MESAQRDQDDDPVSPWSTADRRGSLGRRHKRLSTALESSLPMIVESEEKTQPRKLRRGDSVTSGVPERGSGVSLPRIERSTYENGNKDEKNGKSKGGLAIAAHNTHVGSTNVCGNEDVFEHVSDVTDNLNQALLKCDIQVNPIMEVETEQPGIIKGRKRDVSKEKAVDERADEVEHSGSLPKLKCTHPEIKLNSAKAEQLRKAVKWKTGRERDSDRCVICDITEAATKSAPAESNDALLDIVYPHDFYDRYSRSGRRTCEPSANKEVFTICKPARVSAKLLHRTDSPTGITPQRDPSSSYIGSAIKVDTHHNVSGRPCKFTSKKLQKPVHVQCRPKNTMCVTDNRKDQRLFIKGLRGWLLRKDDVTKISPRESKRSEYQINSLGMQFSIPEYNTSLPIRQTLPFRDTHSSLDRPLTVLHSPTASPRYPDRLGLRPYTHGASPRQPPVQLNIQSMIQHEHSRNMNSGNVPGITRHISGESLIAPNQLKSIPNGISKFKPARAKTMSVENMKALMEQIANSDDAANRTKHTKRPAQTLALPPLRSSVKSGIPSIGRTAS